MLYGSENKKKMFVSDVLFTLRYSHVILLVLKTGKEQAKEKTNKKKKKVQKN